MPAPDKETSARIAEMKARAEKEPIASLLKIKLVELHPGYAKTSIKLLPEHQHVAGIVFGGIITAVADLAFYYAVNSVKPHSVALDFNVHFISPPEIGDELIAEGKCVRSGRRVSFAEITVTNQKGALIAKASGATITTQ